MYANPSAGVLVISSSIFDGSQAWRCLSVLAVPVWKGGWGDMNLRNRWRDVFFVKEKWSSSSCWFWPGWLL